jgi:hypothetical protein
MKNKPIDIESILSKKEITLKEARDVLSTVGAKVSVTRMSCWRHATVKKSFTGNPKDLEAKPSLYLNGDHFEEWRPVNELLARMPEVKDKGERIYGLTKAKNMSS